MESPESIGVYGEAKAEYTRQLCSFLVPALETYFLDLLSDVKSNEKDPKRILWVFQDALKQFPDWNIDKVLRETEKIHVSTKCDYLEEILTAVFIAHTKVLSAIRLTSKQKKLQITIPKLDHFLHRTMSECARLLWSNAYLFAENHPAIERQKNLRQVEQLLHEGVLQSIRGMLPVKSILKEYLADDADETPEAQETAPQEEETAPVVHEESIVPPTTTEEAQKEQHVDLSGGSLEASVPKSQPAIEPPMEAEPTPEVKLEVPKPEAPKPEAPKPEVPKAETPPPPPPTIVVDTEPPTVGFTHMDAVLDSENPERSVIQISNQIDKEDDSHEITRIEYDENEIPEALDEFEELEESKPLAVEADEFETL